MIPAMLDVRIRSLCFFCFAWAGAVATQAAEAPPNVVLVYCDDLGYGDIGCFGAKGYATPAIDRLAKEGRKFTSFYVAQAVCSASRTALLTGCYPNRVGILGALFPASKNGIHDDETTLGEMFRSRGYATACYGKWHLGHHPRFLPVRHGFDEYLGLPYSNDMWPKHPTNKSFPPLPLIDGDKTIAVDPDQSTLTRQYTERAVAFIEKHREQPFFVYLPHTMPHVPIFASEKFAGSTGAGLYGDVIAEIDWSVGQILSTLDRLKVADNTLVVFTSDNGPWLTYGNHAGSAGGLREGKGSTWEGGVRVPFVARWPGRIPADTVCDEPAMTIDLWPTLAKYAGAALPERKIDGRDIGPLLAGEAGAKSPQDAYFFYWGQALEAVRSGPWKLHFPHGYQNVQGQPAGRDGKPGKSVGLKTGLELYHLVDDPAESREVSAAHPEVVERLRKLADAARADLGDALTKTMGTGVREAGRVE